MALRIAHLCDMHVSPGNGSADGFARCLRHVGKLDPPVDLVITGGDHVLDATQALHASAIAQWELVRSVLAEECRKPVLSVLGNHDPWGWSPARSGATGSEPDYGKAMPLSFLGMGAAYGAVDMDGWRIVLLDSIRQEGDLYAPYLDREQHAWLEETIASAGNLHILIVSHVPIVSVAPYFLGRNEQSGQWSIPRQWMHLDARELRDLFQRNGVRLAIAGHMHQIDLVEFHGTTYAQSGSVSGNAWDGLIEGDPAAYSVYSLEDDGHFRRELFTADRW